MVTSNGIDSLFKEKSLFAIYRKSFFLSESGFDTAFKTFTFISIVMFCAYVRLFRAESAYVLFDALDKWSDIGFNYSVQILGFLLAGFTIFATTTNIKVFIGLSKVKSRDRDISQLKFIFFSFIRVFIVHLTVLLSSTVISMLKHINKPLLQIFISDQIRIYNIRSYIVCILCAFLGCFIISALIQLKTFVWNLYQSVVFSIASSATLNSTDSPPKT